MVWNVDYRTARSSPTRPADSGFFFCKFFAAFPGNSTNNVDPADPTKFVAFPGNASNYVGSNPDLAFLEKVPESAGLVGGSGPSLAQT